MAHSENQKWGRPEFEQLQEVVPFLAQAFDVRGDGAYLDKARLDPVGLITEEHTDEMTWTPQCELHGGDSRGIPALPFPFNAGQLAAFMLDGAGWFVYEFATDSVAVDQALHGYNRKMTRDALAAAIESMDAAESVVGEMPQDEAQYVEWRRKMVLALLDGEADKEDQQCQQSAVDRQAQRWQMCVDAGLEMPTDTYAGFPRGIKKIADSIGITRQALTDDLNAYRARVFSKPA